MNPLNHTPAPWLVDFESDEFDSKQSRLCIIDGSEASMSHPQGRLTIAELNVCAFAPHMDEPLANARLISSAPEMLHALELVFSNAGESPEWIRARIGPVIAKAKGQQ